MRHILFSFLSGVFCCVSAYAENFLDKKTYDISDESGYVTFMYDHKNSLILSFLGQAGQSPDQAAAIEAIRQIDSVRVADADLRAALVFVHMNLPVVKEKTIAAFQKNGIHILEGNYDLKRIDASSAYLFQQIDASMDSLAKKGLTLESALISYYLLNPPVDYSVFAPDLPRILVNNAVQIAISRFDLSKWHDEIEICLFSAQKSKDISVSAQKIMTCGRPYTAAVSAEAVRASRQLFPYRPFFDRLKPMNPDEMVKEVDGDSWMWHRKRK